MNECSRGDMKKKKKNQGFERRSLI